MNTSSEAIRLLENALTSVQEATTVIDNLIIEHDFQDVASLVTQAVAALLQSAALMMQSQGDDAFEALDKAEDALDSVYAIIDGEIDDE